MSHAVGGSRHSPPRCWAQPKPLPAAGERANLAPMMARERAVSALMSPGLWSSAEPKHHRSPCVVGLIICLGLTLAACHPIHSAPATRGDGSGAVHATSNGSALAVGVPSSTGLARGAGGPSPFVPPSPVVPPSPTEPSSPAAQSLNSAPPSPPTQQSHPVPTSTTGVANSMAPALLPAVDSACLSEFELALPELPACKGYFQSWMAAFSDASARKAWQRWAEFVLPEAGLLIDNTYEATHSDPASTGSYTSDTIPHAAFLDGTALQRFEQLDLRGGLRCIEDDEVWCPDLFCRPHGPTQIACSNQGGGDPFQYRWTLRQNNWYLTEIYQTWPN